MQVLYGSSTVKPPRPRNLLIGPKITVMAADSCYTTTGCPGRKEAERRKEQEVSVVMQRLSYPTETVLSNKITTNRIVLSFKDPSKPLGRRPKEAEGRKDVPGANRADELDRWGIRRFLGLFVHLGRKGNDFRSFRAEL